MRHYLELFLVVVIHLGTIPAVAYPLTWRFRRPAWADSRVGRALMRKAEAIGLLFAVSLLGIWLGHSIVWAVIYTAVVTWVVLTLWRQFVVLLLVLREGDRSG